MDQAGSESQYLSTKPSGVMGVPPREVVRAWGSVQLQGGGAVPISRCRGGRRGASATDDNAPDVRARRRDAGKIHQTPPVGTKETPAHV